MKTKSSSSKVRIGINGFGRIGRAISRKILSSEDFELCVVNDIEPDLANLEYLFKFDSIYGRYTGDVSRSKNSLFLSGTDVCFYSESRSKDVLWESHEIDVLIEATGVNQNVNDALEMSKSNRVRRTVVTNANPNVDITILFSVNNQEFDPELHSVVSSSICDANAIIPVLNALDNSLGIESCLVTTLHPWLSYQNLLDGPISSVSSPGHNWSEYSLGRSSVGNLILKDTTAGEATLQVLPKLKGKLEAISFRVPTNNVSASDFSVNLSQQTTLEEIISIFLAEASKFPRVVALNNESLVSSDFTGRSESCIIDQNKMKLINGKFLKMVSWYDNEWAYGNRVLDVAKLISGK